MAETYITIETACALTGWSRGHARRELRIWRASGSHPGNGKEKREYPLSALSAAAQAKYAEEARKGLAIVRAEQTLPLFASAQSLPRIAIPEALEDQARKRLEAIRPLLDFRERTKSSRTEVVLSDGHRVKTLQEIAEWVAPQHKTSWQSIWRWLDRFDHGGYPALADRPRKDRNKSRFFEEHPAGATFLQQKFLKEGLSREMAWEALCREWKKLGEKGPTPVMTRREIS